ncbi:hypothetical protein PHYSODRAFT_348627 [Phytophthora sojae]|uniref:Uncharacterized protein n=1 Tax=Phytophthora sojae (strain P6497) TaxID=1094619 RepID=G5AGQ9_PHYSP|nr:hypothetical protein PHYSODRAFT_348627 [Phytophthora sojae]EGZ05339.1 hypothetical protein PHYSODRAFT_348627 [Phytophthora sojae]|eukprot:XP_009539260.1 hypothetical protein PHYSODRAFT_348627 [Phytophthora sojae]
MRVLHSLPFNSCGAFFKYFGLKSAAWQCKTKAQQGESETRNVWDIVEHEPTTLTQNPPNPASSRQAGHSRDSTALRDDHSPPPAQPAEHVISTRPSETCRSGSPSSAPPDSKLTHNTSRIVEVLRLQSGRVHEQHAGGSNSVSTSSCSGFQQSSSSPSSSPHSHGFSQVDSDAWLPAPPDLPENLDGLASFVERASAANARDMQWNQEELDYYSEILRESGRFKPEFSKSAVGSGHTTTSSSSHSRRTQSYTQGFHPVTSLPPPDHAKLDRRATGCTF